MAHTVKKNTPAMPEIQVLCLGWEGPLEKEMATHSQVFLPGEFHTQRSLAGYKSTGLQRVGHD